MRTNDLRAAIKSTLETIPASYGIEEVSYGHAINEDLYPHIVFGFTGTSLADFNRKDYTVDIDVWDRGHAERAFNIADKIEDLFVFRNDPKTNILPTFYLQARVNAEDDDKDINHIVIRMTTQLYDNI